MEPLSISLLIISLASAAAGAYSGYATNKAAAKQTKYNAEYNAKLAENEAEQERMNRLAAEREEREAARRNRAIMESRYAKSGLLLTGTPADFLTEQAAVDELNAQEGNRVSDQKREGLASAAWMTRSQGSQEAKAFRTAGTTALINGLGQAAQAGAMYGMSSTKTPSTKSSVGGTSTIPNRAAIAATFKY